MLGSRAFPTHGMAAGSSRVLQQCALYLKLAANPPPALPPHASCREGSWPDNPWIGGAYTTFYTPGTWTQFGEALRRPVGRVFWAGTEMSTVWPVRWQAGRGISRLDVCAHALAMCLPSQQWSAA